MTATTLARPTGVTPRPSLACECELSTGVRCPAPATCLVKTAHPAVAGCRCQLACRGHATALKLAAPVGEAVTVITRPTRGAR